MFRLDRLSSRIGSVFIELFHALRAAFVLARVRRRSVSRAATAYELASTLTVSRPHDWQRRSNRAFTRVIRLLAPAGEPTMIVAAPTAPDVARTMLRQARRPFFRLLLLGCAALGLVAVVATAVLLSVAVVSPRTRHWLFPVDVARAARWTSSSAFPGTQVSGTSLSSVEPFFFHTNAEEHPWLRIELPRTVGVTSIRIRARTDCCAERTVPLNVEVPDGDGWRLVCQRRVPFATWTCHPKGVRTSVIRIRLAAHNMLHLSSVQVFE